MAVVKSQEKEIQNLSDIRFDGRKHFTGFGVYDTLSFNLGLMSWGQTKQMLIPLWREMIGTIPQSERNKNTNQSYPTASWASMIFWYSVASLIRS